MTGVLGSIGPASLLIADDDPGCRDVLRDILEPRGYRTLLAANGEEALALIDENEVDCLLLDMHMPVLTGLETLKLVRQIRFTLPCIMITAETSPQLLQQALLLHVFTVLSKPIQQEAVTISVRRALRQVLPPSA